MLLGHNVRNVTIKIDNKLWIPRLKAVVSFEIFSYAIISMALKISKASANQNRAVYEFLESRDLFVKFCAKPLPSHIL